MTRVYAETNRIVDFTRIDAADVKTPIDALDTQIAELVFTGGRLSADSSDPNPPDATITSNDIYYLPYGGAPDCGLLSLWNSSTSGLNQFDFSASPPSVSLAAVNPGELNDVFAYINSGAVALELLAWSSSTAGSSSRATALAWANGILCKSGDATRRYLGTVRGFGAGETNDSLQYRSVYNAYNQTWRALFVADSTSSWTYATATWRASNNDAAGNSAFCVAGLDGTPARLTFSQAIDGTSIGANIGIAQNGTTPAYFTARDGSGIMTLQATLTNSMTAGHHTFTPCEYVSASTATFYGNGETMAVYGFVMG